MPSYSPEAVHLTKRPVFNTRASSLYTDGDVTPPGLKAVDVTSEVTLLDQDPVASVAITTAGSGLADGTPTNVATTAITGAGTGLTVDITVAGGEVTVAAVNAAGDGYLTGDTVSINGYAGTVLTVQTAAD